MTFDDTELQSNGVTVSHPMTSFKFDAREVLFVPTPTPRIHGYDVSYQVLGIWEGFSQQQLSISSTLTGGPLDPPLTAPHTSKTTPFISLDTATFILLLHFFVHVEDMTCRLYRPTSWNKGSLLYSSVAGVSRR